MLLIGAGVAGMFLTALTGAKKLPVIIFTTALFIASIIAFISYFVPYIELKVRVHRLKKICTEPVRARCEKTGEIPYTHGNSSLIVPFYRMYEWSGDEDSDPHINEQYYDPEYVFEYKCKVYHVSEHRRTVFGAFQDNERTIYICPDDPNIFYDERRYCQELKDNSENILRGIPSRLIFPAITTAIMKFFIL